MPSILGLDHVARPQPTLPGEMAALRPATLEAEGLVAGYGDIEVVNGIDVAVSDGSLVSIVGPNGAGKSTLLKAILGLVTVFGGCVRLDGVDVTGRPLEQPVRLGIGYVRRSTTSSRPSVSTRTSRWAGISSTGRRAPSGSRRCWRSSRC
jgi:ABC-type Mn2+/Zn2+ transport system ATPase subunit